MRRLVPILLGSTAFWFSGLAFAQATPEGAAALQQGLAEILSPTLTTGGAGSAVLEGGWTVEPVEAEYHITAPALALSIRADADGRKRVIRIRCDADRYTASAPAGGTVYRLYGDAPYRCEIRPSGEAPAVITSRTRSVDFTVDLARGSVRDYADQSEGLVLTIDGQSPVTLDRLRLTGTTVARTDARRQDVAVRIEAEGLSGGDSAGRDGVTLAHARYSGRMEDVDFAALRGRLWQLLELGLDAARRDPKAPAPPNFERKLDTLVRQAMALAASTVETEMVLTDLRAVAPEDVARLDSLTIAAGYRGLDQADLGAGLGGRISVSATGLAVEPREGRPVGPVPSFAIDRLQLTGALDPDQDRKVSGAGFTASIEGVSFAEPDEDIAFTLTRGRYGGRVDGLDVAGFVGALQAILSLVERKPAGHVTPDETAPLLDRARQVTDALAGYKVEFGLNDLQVTGPEFNLALGTAGYEEAFQGLDSDNGTGSWKITLDGLKIEPPLPFAEWIPQNGTIAVSIKDVPSKSLKGLFWDGIQTAANEAGTLDGADGVDPFEQAGRDFAEEIVQRIATLLLQSGASLTFDTFRISAPKAAIDFGGTAKADPASIYGVTADATLRLVGFDDVIKFLQTLPDGQEAAAGMTMLQVLGRQAETDDGTSARDYDIVVDAGGKMLINGTDLSALAPKLPQ